MMKWKLVILLILPMFGLLAQNALQINGYNEAQFVYRTAPDSLNTYFSNSFGFNLRYQDFRFGMVLNSALPKYSNEQTELMQEIDPARLSVKWEELYAGFNRDLFSLHVGTTEETFGNGIVFRSFEDIEFDEDHRLQSALMRYDGKLKLKTLYGAINSPINLSRYDLAYGADAEYPVLSGVRLGASAMAFRDLTPLNSYSHRDVFAGRMKLSLGSLEAFSEYAAGKEYRLGNLPSGNIQALYANAEYLFGDLIVGASYKNYEGFDYRLNDIPLANYHGETLSDALGSGQDEEGWQARASYHLAESIYLIADYAEAWDSSKDKQMNDLFFSAEYSGESNTYLASWSHIEKVDDAARTWQKEYYPALGADIRNIGMPLYLQAEFKTVEKQHGATTSSHYEPLLQADFRIRKLGVSLGLQSWWADFDTILQSKYNPNIELKYPVFEHSDLILFAGKEQGGKVCRNGMCRFVAPFEGLRAEFTTRF
jgi:hypothetical protein